MMQCVIQCKRTDCEFNYQGNTCSYGGDYLMITENGCETFELKDLEIELMTDIKRVCSDLFPNYYNLMPQEFVKGILSDVVTCSDFLGSGLYTDSDIRISIEREVASKFGVEI